MVPYDQLLPIEQAIVDFKMENPYLCGFLLGILIAITICAIVSMWKDNVRREQERMKAERAARRAWIKAHGGL